MIESKPTIATAIETLTVLVVEDEASITRLVRLYLEQSGFRVVAAADGLAALTLHEREQPALVILDLMLPELDGWEVCRRIRATSRTPILMLTARQTEEDRVAGLDLGADDYVTKPFSPRELVSRVRAILRRAAQPETSTADYPDLPWPHHHAGGAPCGGRRAPCRTDRQGV